MKKSLIQFLKMSFLALMLVTPSYAASQNPPTSPELGCSCAGLKWCMVGACADLNCAPCGDYNTIGCAVCECRLVGMKHCSNWEDIINESSCSTLKTNYCNAINSDSPNVNSKCFSDPVCQSTQTKKGK